MDDSGFRVIQEMNLASLFRLVWLNYRLTLVPESGLRRRSSKLHESVFPIIPTTVKCHLILFIEGSVFPGMPIDISFWRGCKYFFGSWQSRVQGFPSFLSSGKYLERIIRIESLLIEWKRRRELLNPFGNVLGLFTFHSDHAVPVAGRNPVVLRDDQVKKILCPVTCWNLMEKMQEI